MGFLTTRIQHKLQCLLRLSLLFGWASLLVLPSKAQEADNCQDKTFQITATSTRSTCQSNGTITVELGEGSEDFYEFQYQILGSNGSFSYPAQRDNVLIGIPPGRHLVNVNGLCKDNNKVKKFVSLPVIVEGDYAIPEINTISNKVYPSYQECHTGQYAFRMSNGSGNFTYTLIEAPEGVDVPWEFTPTESGLDLIIPRRLPPGNYKLLANDGCYQAVRDFTIGLRNNRGVPNVGLNGIFRSLDGQTSCDSVIVYQRTWDVNTVWGNFNYDEFEWGVGYKEEYPTVWYDFPYDNNHPQKIALPAGKVISDFYPNNAERNVLRFYIRYRGCPQVEYYYEQNVLPPDLGWNTQENCENYIATIYVNNPHRHTNYGNFGVCYPVTVRLYKDNREAPDQRTYHQ